MGIKRKIINSCHLYPLAPLKGGTPFTASKLKRHPQTPDPLQGERMQPSAFSFNLPNEIRQSAPGVWGLQPSSGEGLSARFLGGERGKAGKVLT
jgi:hypothetical protein